AKLACVVIEVVLPDTRWIAKRIADLRLARGWNQEQLGAAAGVSSSNISKIERGETERPHTRTLDAIAQAFGWPDRHPLLAGDDPPPRHPPGRETPADANVVGPVDELRPAWVRPVPIYRWGSCGDPRSREAAPDPDRLEYPPLYRESLIGPSGFGIEVRGESMARRNIHDGDVVWVNPDKPPRLGGIVAARCWSDEGEEMGVVVKVWRRGDAGEALYSAPERESDPFAVQCRRFELI